MENPKSNPKLKKHPKSKRINVSGKVEWRRILREVDKDHVPINFLDTIVLHLLDETEVTIEVKKLLDSGANLDTLEQDISKKLSDLDQYIKDVDFLISVDAVNEIVKPLTNQILKDL